MESEKEKLRLAVVVTKNNKLAMDIKTQRPLIHGADMLHQLQELLSMMVIQKPYLYGECKIIIVEEIDDALKIQLN